MHHKITDFWFMIDHIWVFYIFCPRLTSPFSWNFFFLRGGGGGWRNSSKMRDFTWKISLISVSNKGKLFVRVICRETFHNCSPKLKKLFLTTCIIWKENWKISFYQESQLFENGICISNFCAKNADISKIMKTWEIISIFFHKLSRCITIVPNSMFLACFYPEISSVGKNDLPWSIKTLNGLGLTALKQF